MKTKKSQFALHTPAAGNLARPHTQRVAELRSEFKQGIAELRTEFHKGQTALETKLIRWMFVFWAGSTFTILGTMVALLKS